MNVQLIGNTYAIEPDILKHIENVNFLQNDTATITTAAKQCYNKEFDYKEFFKKYTENKESNELFIKRIAESGHTSILEHASATFLITGVSRSLTHQLVRHRIASYTQQSQRYVDMEEFKFVIPPSILKCNNEEVLTEYNYIMNRIEKSYKFLVSELVKSGRTEQQAREDARFVLPNAAETQIVMTMNYRELGDFLGKRMCKRAQWEIRAMATEIFNIMSKQSPAIFGKESIYRGPKCKNLGYCNEHKSCGLTLKYIRPVKAIEEPKNKTWLQRLKDVFSI